MRRSVRRRNIRPLQGEARVPSDKSITHRAILFSAFALGDTEVLCEYPGRDNIASLRIVRQLGLECALSAPESLVELLETEGFSEFDLSPDTLVRIRIRGRGFDGLCPPDSPLDCGNSGTTARLLCGLLAGRSFPVTLTGDESLRRRPFRRVVEPLSEMGARFSGDQLPFEIEGGRLHGIQYRAPVASAQVKSALLIAGLQADGETNLVEPYQSRDHTERMLQAMSVSLSISKDGPHGRRIIISGGQEPRALGVIRVPGDFSSAAFFLVASSIIPGSEVVLRDVLFNPTRIGLFELLERMGASLEILSLREVGGEPVVDLRVRSAELFGISVTGEDVVRAIDEIPALAVASAFARGETVIHGAAELRVKESDRIQQIVDLLETFEIEVEEFPDGFRIVGQPELFGSVEDIEGTRRSRWRSSGDHRIAMSGMILTYAGSGVIELPDLPAVETSFPNYSELFTQLQGGL